MPKNHSLYAITFAFLNFQVIRFISKVTLLASGGVGHIYPSTTNPLVLMLSHFYHKLLFPSSYLRKNAATTPPTPPKPKKKRKKKEGKFGPFFLPPNYILLQGNFFLIHKFIAISVNLHFMNLWSIFKFDCKFDYL